MSDFIQNLMDMRGGRTAAQINDMWDKLIESVIETGKKGKLVVDIAMEPAGNGKMEVTCTPKITAPIETIGSTSFYITPNRSLTRQDPKQFEMDFQQQQQQERSK